MPVSVKNQGNIRILLLQGAIGMRESLDFARELKSASTGPWETIVIDLQCPTINSHCLGTLLATYNTLKSMPKNLKLVSADSTVTRALTSFRIVPLLPLFESIQDALAGT
ncbi:MAG: STAS domain-containing protein [bacterium]